LNLESYERIWAYTFIVMGLMKPNLHNGSFR
jgi:hypothetical protein